MPIAAQFFTEENRGTITFDAPLQPGALSPATYEFRINPNIRPVTAANASGSLIEALSSFEDPYNGDPLAVYYGGDPALKGINGVPVAPFTIPCTLM